MATTDINGMVFYASPDQVTPLQNAFNAQSTAMTNALNGTTRTFRVANQAARDALLVSRGASSAAPLQVDRADTGMIQRNVTGLTGGWFNLPGGVEDWGSYTPVLTAATTNPAGYTATGAVARIGRLRVVTFQIVASGGFNPGSGPYSISVPDAGVFRGVTSGAVRLYDSSTGNAHLGARVAMSSATTVAMQYTITHGGTLDNVGSTVPWVWGPNDIMDGFFIYESVA